MIRHLPAGTYTLRAFLDANNDRIMERRESWDSAAVPLADSARVELFAFVHDTIGPRIQTVTVRDSLTLRVQFDQPLDNAFAIGADAFHLRGADSADVPVTDAMRARDWDTHESDREIGRASWRGRV